MADGITAVIYNVTKELAKRGHEVSVCTSDMMDLQSNKSLGSGHKVVNGVNVYYLTSIWRSKTFIVTPALLSLLSSRFSDYDIIHIHDCRSFQGIGSFLFSKMKKVPYVFQPHGSYISYSQVSMHKLLAKRLLDFVLSDQIVHNASKIIALNQMEAEQYEQFGVPAEKICIIPNGIDLTQYSDLPAKGSFKKKFGIDENSKIVLYVGRIHESKGIGLLIKSYAYLVNNMSNQSSVLVIAGSDDGYLKNAVSLVSSLGLSDSVLFTGFLNQKDKLAALIDAELFVTPAFSGFPMTFLEACIVGTPILTTTMGDKLDWIKDNVGCVTSPNEVNLAFAIQKMFFDKTLHNGLSKNCVDLVKSSFSINTIVDKLETIYSQVS